MIIVAAQAILQCVLSETSSQKSESSVNHVKLRKLARAVGPSINSRVNVANQNPLISSSQDRVGRESREHIEEKVLELLDLPLVSVLQ